MCLHLQLRCSGSDSDLYVLSLSFSSQLLATALVTILLLEVADALVSLYLRRSSDLGEQESQGYFCRLMLRSRSP